MHTKILVGNLRSLTSSVGKLTHPFRRHSIKEVTNFFKTAKSVGSFSTITMAASMKVWSWEELEEIHNRLGQPVDLANGPTTSQSRLRLFGRPESEVRVTLYRDHHAWCPYCQKCGCGLKKKEFLTGSKKLPCFVMVKKNIGIRKLFQ